MHAARSSRWLETFLLLDLRSFSFLRRLNFLSFLSPFLLRILPPAVGLPFQSMYKSCCSETGCPSSNTEFPTSTVHESLFRPLFLSPHSPTPRSWVHISDPDNLNLYRRSRHFTCLFLFRFRFCFGAVKPPLSFLRFLSLGRSWFAPSRLSLFEILFR